MSVGSPPLGSSQKRFHRLRDRIEVFLSGRAPDDPLYLSNRSWKQKVRIAALIAVPVLLVGTMVTIGATDVFRFRRADPYDHPSAEVPAASTAPKRLPDPVLNSAELEVVNIKIAKDARAPVVTGVVRNNSNQKVASAEVSYYLADTQGSLVGTDTAEVAALAAHSSVSFRMPLKIAKAEYVIVREVRPN